MEEVLRAMDIIPPFAGHSGSHGRDVNSTHCPPSQAVARADRFTQDHMPSVVASDDITPQSEGGANIPTLDLGEKILAEQRRMTARKRKGPGGPEPEVNPESKGIEDERPPAATVASTETIRDDVVQLQQIVAGIVSRDIERLCKGLKHAVCGFEG